MSNPDSDFNQRLAKLTSITAEEAARISQKLKELIHGDDWLKNLATTTRYSLEDLHKAHYLVPNRTKFESAVKLAGLTGEKTIYGYIYRLIQIGMIPIPPHIKP